MHDRQTWLKAADHAHARGEVKGEARGLAKGRAEGLAEGLSRGALLGRIEALQQVLRRESTPHAALEAMPIDALEALADDLERELSP